MNIWVALFQRYLKHIQTIINYSSCTKVALFIDSHANHAEGFEAEHSQKKTES